MIIQFEFARGSRIVGDAIDLWPERQAHRAV